MTDYIKRDKRQRTFIEIADDLNDLVTELNDKIVESIREENADAVPVVRCKDCRWWDNSEDSSYGYCMAMQHGFMSEKWEIGIYRIYKGDFYCADGERGDSDDE